MLKPGMIHKALLDRGVAEDRAADVILFALEMIQSSHGVCSDDEFRSMLHVLAEAMDAAHALRLQAGLVASPGLPVSKGVH